MNRLLLISAFALAPFAALAADLPARAPAAAPAPLLATVSWSGVYAGAQLGWQRNRDKYTDSAGSDFGANISSGLIGGVHVGYNHQSGAWVFGAEADIEYSGDRWTEFNFPGSDNEWGYRAKSSFAGSLRVRLGYAVGPALFYVTGGLAAGEASRTFFDELPAFSSKFSTLHVGWAVGAGVEYALTSAWSARLEYRYTDLGKASDYNPEWQTFDRTDLTQHTVRVGVSYRFGAAAAPVVARY